MQRAGETEVKDGSKASSPRVRATDVPKAKMDRDEARAAGSSTNRGAERSMLPLEDGMKRRSERSRWIFNPRAQGSEIQTAWSPVPWEWYQEPRKWVRDSRKEMTESLSGRKMEIRKQPRRARKNHQEDEKREKEDISFPPDHTSPWTRGTMASLPPKPPHQPPLNKIGSTAPRRPPTHCSCGGESASLQCGVLLPVV